MTGVFVKRGLHTDGAEGKWDEEMQGEDGGLQGKERRGADPPLAAPRRTNSDHTHRGFTSSLHNREKINLWVEAT